ncbi:MULTISPECIES: FIST signal transduction protein [unclassified Streptomyces]|uniref:FIST C-terminal domain-containing protein n=1 Tax=Streptomyces sp. NBC_00180 TaxID=2903632 RepID=A0AAU1IAL7_9ACTN|nr:FIST C-terminal domain-containing protein [Streptomyces sp. NBC_01017]WSV34954.1 FIST C-terminal domain-containing protein [Streptomyces sp. NBC_01017]
MSTIFGTGMSRQRNPEAAAQEVVDQALRTGPIDEPDFAFLFASVGYDQAALVESVWEAAGRIPLVGCSGEGIIVGDEPDESNFAVALLLGQSDSVSFRHGLVSGLKENCGSAGRTLADQVAPLTADDRLLFLFPDGMTVTADELLAGFDEGLEEVGHLPVLGGTAADNNTYEQSYQYYDGKVAQDGAAWAVLSGAVQVVPVVGHGCVPIGLDLTLTDVDRQTVKEIDGKPAIEVFRDYLSSDELTDWQPVILSLPFGFPAVGADGVEGYVPYVSLSQNAETGAIRLPILASEGTRVRLMRRDIDLLLTSADEIARKVNEDLGHRTPDLIMHFECAGRGRHFLREEPTRQLFRRLQSQLPSVPRIGFYGYGELCPVSGRNRVHQFTSVVAALVCS